MSGAEFDRPGLGRLLAALEGRPPFDVLIISEQSRLGRSTIPTLALIKQLLMAGVRVFTYLDDREIALDDQTGEIQAFIGSWASSSERRKARQRTAEALARKAAAGHSAGGRVFGYSNVCEGCGRTMAEGAAIAPAPTWSGAFRTTRPPSCAASSSSAPRGGAFAASLSR